MGFSARRESFLVSIGQFLDKYHISSRAKDQARLLLVRGFVYLDSISIPDAPRATLAFLLRPRERIEMRFAIFLYLSSLVLIGLTLYWNFLSLPEFAIAIVLTISFLEALTPYIPWSAILQVAAYFARLQKLVARTDNENALCVSGARSQNVACFVVVLARLSER